MKIEYSLLIVRYSAVVLLMVAVGSFARAQTLSYSFAAGFNPKEFEDLMHLNFAIQDSSGTLFIEDFLAGYAPVRRTPSVGLDNQADLWIRSDSTVVVVLRGTTRAPSSLLADFYCAMLPANGTIQLDKERTFDYRLSTDSRAAVHAGFLIGMVFIAAELENDLAGLYDQGYRDFLISGHSQGGALAYLFSSWLQETKSGTLPGLRVKTYASASPKIGNRYFSYDFDYRADAKWAFSIINTQDPIPEMPFTTQQVDVDMNEPNPILNMTAGFKSQPLLKRFVLTRAFNKMRNKAKRSSKAYQRYLGDVVGDVIQKILPDVQVPEAVATTYFTRPGVHIILPTTPAYEEQFSNARGYVDHGVNAYRFLLREHFQGLPKYESLKRNTSRTE